MKKKWLAILITALMVLVAVSPVYAGWSRLQDQMHSIAQTAREAGLQEESPIIAEASRIWWEENVRMTREAEERAEAEAELQGFLQEHYADAVAMAGVMYAEARGLSMREMSMVSWCILNRWDTQRFGSTLSSVIWSRSQFAHSKRTVSDNGTDLIWLAQDVLARWWKEQHGEIDVGRTLPAGYVYYAGDGHHNYFREYYRGRGSYNFGLWDPYS